MVNPRLNLHTFSIEEYTDHSFVIDLKTGNKFKLELIDTTVMKCINGSRSVEEIKQETRALLSYDIDEEIIFKALDRLSDIGVVQDRLLPPSGGQLSSRRQFMAKVAGALAFGAIGVSPVAFSDNSQQAQEQRAKRAQERDQKQASEKTEKQAREQDRKISQEIRAKERARDAEEREKKKNK